MSQNKEKRAELESQAAEILGITRGKLRDRISTYNIVFDSGVTIKDAE